MCVGGEKHANRLNAWPALEHANLHEAQLILIRIHTICDTLCDRRYCTMGHTRARVTHS